MRRLFAIGAAMLALSGAPMARAQDGMVLAVGKITTQQSCQQFQQSEGRAAVAANRWAVAAAVSWRTWWVKDCTSDFPTMRSALESALAASGKFRIGSRGARHTVSINITGVSGGEGPPPETPDADGFSITQTFMVVSMNVSVRDQNGHEVFGGVVTKRLEVGSDEKAGGLQATRNTPGEAAFGKMQNELALSAARLVLFHFAPIKVVLAEGKQVRLNYGAPLLPLVALIIVASPDGRAAIRYRVTTAGSGFAFAELDGDGDYRSIFPGSTGSYVELDDPADKSRRFRKVELP